MTDEEQIAEFLANRGPTRCPTRFAAVTKSACIDDQVAFAPKPKGKARPQNWWRSEKKLRQRWAYASF